MCILQYDSKRMSKIFFLDLVNINSVIADLTILNIVETIDQICNCRLTGSCLTYESNLLPLFFIKLHIMKVDFVIIVSEIHSVKYNIPF